MISAGCPMYCFECETCNEYYEEFFTSDEYPREVPCTCGEYARIIIATAPSLGKGTNDDSFHPYYDGQLGQHFQSKQEKDKWLKDNGYKQVSGPSCPSKDKIGNFKCTKSQASKV